MATLEEEQIVNFEEALRSLPQYRARPRVPSVPSEFERSLEQAKEQDREQITSSERVRLLVAAAKDPENQKNLARMGLEVGAGIGASYLTGGLSNIPRGLALAARMTAAGAGEATGSLISESFDPSESPGLEAAKKFGYGFFGEAVGSLAARLARGGTVLEEGGREAFEAIQARGATLMPGQVSKSRMVDVPQVIAESSLFGGGYAAKVKQRAFDVASESVEEFIKKFRSVATKEQMDDLVRESLVGNSESFRSAGRSLYKELDDALGGAGSAANVDLTPFLDELTLASKEFGNQGARRILGEWKKFASANKIKDPSSISFADAQDIRSFLLGIGRQGQDLVASGAQATGKRLAPLVDRAMANSARESGPEVLSMFRNANKFWKNGVKKFNSKLVRSITREEPREVFSAMGKTPRAIRSLRTTINDPDVWREVQGQFLRDMWEGSLDEFGTASGKKMALHLKRFGSAGLDEMFSRGELDNLRQVVRAMTFAEGEAGKRIPGGIFIQLKQAWAAGQVGSMLLGATGVVDPKMATLIIIGPAAMARILGNPTVSRYLTVGMKARPGSQQAIRAFGQVAAWLTAEGLGRPYSQEEFDESATSGNMGVLPKFAPIDVRHQIGP